ncbi:uncharacterized protein B0T23DRAFT_447950 [Neurospora hispaniola]|uniref:Uncharacterized protein n=1 Tax=Neurospora hispaniola TaxID=588809 RepID=A0AAJ0I1D2_9PEZI|nr:hypothetical protein B0T23DRAFT_447950 [Neurospora hispaniola]
MCLINIIHFSHHHDFSPPVQTPNTNSSSSSSSFSISTTCNNYHLSNPTRLTEQEELMSLQRLPQHHFVPCPTHTNNHCVVYKQTMPCLLQRFHSSSSAAAAEVNANANADSEEGEGGINVLSTCPNLQLTNEYHPLSLLLADNNNTESNSIIPGPIHRFQTSDTTTTTTTTTLSQAKTTLLSTADEIHQQTVVLNTHILETCSLLTPLFQKLAAVHTTHTTQPTTPLLQRAQTRALFMQLESEVPLQRASELCQAINQAEVKIRELFKVFLQRRKSMSDLLVAVENKEGTDSAYTISKARRDLRELSVANIREVCEEPVRRGREVVGEVVRVLEGVESMLGV